MLPGSSPFARVQAQVLGNGIGTRVVYIIKFVADMDTACAFYGDRVGLKPRFASPFWSEFETGETVLALHPASEKNPAGSCQLGFRVDDLAALYAARAENGLAFSVPPAAQRGALIARFIDSEGAECSVSG